MSSELIFNLLYLLVSFGIVYPPAEFISAGFTIQNLFSNILGSEKERFIRYHIKRSILNLFVYSFLPVIYLLLLFLLGFVEELSSLFIGTTLYWNIFATTCVILPFLALFEYKRWTDDNYRNHPIVVNLRKCCNNNSTWESVASDIENEFRSYLAEGCSMQEIARNNFIGKSTGNNIIKETCSLLWNVLQPILMPPPTQDKLNEIAHENFRLEIVSIKTNPVVNVIVTENWILKVTLLTLFVAHQSDATLNVKEANSYQLSHMSSNEAQFLNIEVKSTRVDPFTIRINATDFKDLEDRLARSINILPEVKFHKSVTERFLEVFKDTVGKNPRYYTDLEIEQCIGCLQAPSEIKIQKQCQDAENNPGSNCTNCFCRPMWCVYCITKWFISRQDPDQKSQWLSSKCTCPMCRATFCVLDVSLISEREE